MRLHVAKQGLWKAGVVLNHAKHVVVPHPLVEQLHAAKLNAFLEDFSGRGRGARPHHDAANVHPVHQDAEKSDRFWPVITVSANRGVHDDIVQMLAQCARVVGDDHVSRQDVVQAVDVHAVLDRGPKGIGHKNGQRAS